MKKVYRKPIIYKQEIALRCSIMSDPNLQDNPEPGEEAAPARLYI